MPLGAQQATNVHRGKGEHMRSSQTVARSLVACLFLVVAAATNSRACDVHGETLDLQSGYAYKDLRIANYHSCNGLTVRDFNVQVIWGDNGESQDPNTHAKILESNILGASHIFNPVRQPTDYIIRVGVHAVCVETGHPDYPDDCASTPEGTAKNHNGVAHVYPAMPPKAVTLNPSSIPAGTSTKPYEGIVDLFGPAPASGMIVALTSSDPAHVIVPAELKVPAGLSSASFSFTTRKALHGKVRISAINAGQTRQANLTIK